MPDSKSIYDNGIDIDEFCECLRKQRPIPIPKELSYDYLKGFYDGVMFTRNMKGE